MQVDLAPLALEPAEALTRLREHGIMLSPTPHPSMLRAVTHLDVTDADVEAAVDAVPRALGTLARV